MRFKKKVILWDWNGTLLDDLDICLDGINILLRKRNLPLLTKHRYRQIFTFPVKDYYQMAGFDYSKEPFEIPAEEFIVHYKEMLARANLFSDAFDALSLCKDFGLNQYILSAMEQTSLVASVQERDIAPFFEGICGIGDNYAHSKVENAKKLISLLGINPEETILIGDTVHDAEVANEIGVDVILVSRGHQSEERLQATGLPIINELKNLKEFIN